MSTDKSAPSDLNRSIFKSSVIISSGTMLSRLLGFVRDIFLAKILGTGFRADRLYVGFKIPNLFRDLLGEGAANSAVIPVLTEYKYKQSKEEFWNFVNVFLCIAFIALSIVTIVGMIFAPFIIRIIAPGFIIEPEKFLLAISLTKTLFPYLILIGLTAYFAGVLFTFKSFISASFSPCLLNVIIILSAILSNKLPVDPVYVLAYGVLIGGVLQLLVQMPSLYRQGFKFNRVRSLDHPAAKKIGRLIVPRIFGSGVYQLNVFVDTLCASLSNVVGVGGVSALYYSNRILQLPLAIFSTALSSAILPALADLHIKEDKESFQKSLVHALKNMIFIMFPITLILIFIS